MTHRTLPGVTGDKTNGMRAIRAGVLRHVREAVANNQALLGELELAKRLGCQRPEIRRALAELEHEGIVKRRQGAPTAVDPLALRMNVRLEEQQEHSDLLARLGYQATVEAVENEVIDLPDHLISMLEATAGSKALRTVKRWLADGRPAMVSTNTLLLPEGVAEQVDPTESIFVLVKELWGDSIGWEVVTPGAAVVAESTARLLDIPEGQAAVTLEAVGVGLNGRRLFHAFEYHAPQIMSYSLVRTAQPPW